jgi:hypothetical protein
MHAVRKNRYVVLAKDIEKGYKANVKKSGGLLNATWTWEDLR